MANNGKVTQEYDVPEDMMCSRRKNHLCQILLPIHINQMKIKNGDEIKTTGEKCKHTVSITFNFKSFQVDRKFIIKFQEPRKYFNQHYCHFHSIKSKNINLKFKKHLEFPDFKENLFIPLPVCMVK